MPEREKPPIIQEVGFDFSWDESKVWQLDLPVEEMPREELEWHLDVPFIWSKPDGYYDVNPSEVVRHPDQYTEEYERTMQADPRYPIDIMHWRGRWVILDGLHRLMQAVVKGRDIVEVRKVPQEMIPLIRKDNE